MASEAQIMAAIAAAQDAVNGRYTYDSERLVRKLLEAAERVAPIAAPKAFDVEAMISHVLQRNQHTKIEGWMVRYVVGLVNNQLGKQGKEQPSSEPERVAKAFELSAAERHWYDCARLKPTYMGNCLTGAIDRALATLGPTEREKELERELATEKQCNQGLSEMLTARDVELAQAKERENDLKEVLRAHSKQVSDAMERAERSENQLAHAKEREKALELRLSDAIGSAIDAAKACGDTDAEFTQLRAKLAECEHQLAVGEGHMLVLPLSDEQRRLLESLSRDLGEGGDGHGQLAIDSLLARFPKPAPVDPVEALIAKWRSHDAGSFNGGLHTAFADELEQALAAQKETRR